MKKSSIVLAVILLLCLIGWGYTYREYRRLETSWQNVRHELSDMQRKTRYQYGPDTPYEGKTDKEILEMLPPPDYNYVVKYYKTDSVYYTYREVWDDLLVDGVDTVLIKGFDWEFDHRITNLSKLHIDFVQKGEEWVVNVVERWDPEVVVF
jgi:hypothetical protein